MLISENSFFFFFFGLNLSELGILLLATKRIKLKPTPISQTPQCNGSQEKTLQAYHCQPCLDLVEETYGAAICPLELRTAPANTTKVLASQRWIGL